MHKQVTNDDRANWAEVALEAFAKECGMEDELADLEGWGCVYSDLISDLMHAMVRDDIDPAEVLNRAISHFDYESNPDYEGD